MQQQELETICPASTQEWRSWLEANHASKGSVWIIYYKKKAGKPTISWSEAVDQALCFGWIDSTARSIDDDTYMQFFCPRKLTSAWSKINKEKVKYLIAEGLMTAAGYASIETAKQNGSWTILDEVEELIVPEDLETAFGSQTGSKDFFLSLSKSVRKSMLQWLVLAKRPETRRKRVSEIAELASQGLKPKQFR